MSHASTKPTSLRRYTYLSIAAAIATILLKAGAYWLTGSVGLLSDALESVVNLAAALMALWMLTIAERDRIWEVLVPYEEHGIAFHSLRTREAGPRRFISFHVLVPGTWSVQHGHDVLELIEHDVRSAFDTPTTVFTHLEPIEDPLSLDDVEIDRLAQP